jgi:hypothetical protein
MCYATHKTHLETTSYTFETLPFIISSASYSTAYNSLYLTDVLNFDHNPQICSGARSYPWCNVNVLGQILTLDARVNSYAFRSCPDGEGQGQVLDLNCQLVPLTLEEREHILGYPTGSTNIPGLSYSARHHILGSCFDAFAVSHLFACAFALRFFYALSI